MSKSRTEGGALVAIVIALGGAHAASADATAHQRCAGGVRSRNRQLDGSIDRLSPPLQPVQGWTGVGPAEVHLEVDRGSWTCCVGAASRSPRQDDVEDGAPAGTVADDADRSPMGIDDGFADREPDPGSGTLPATRRVAAVEAFENMGQLIGRNAVAIIGHGDHGPLRLRAPRDGDVSAGGRVAKRVGQKVAQHLSDPVGVDVDAQAVGLAEVQGEVDALVLIAAARGFRASEQEIASAIEGGIRELGAIFGGGE